MGARLADRGRILLLQPGLTRVSLHDYRLGQILDALFAAHLNRVFGAMALNALEVSALSTPWLYQEWWRMLAAHAKEAERLTAHVQHVAARWFAGAAAAAPAMAEYEGRGQGRRGRQLRPWRYHGLPDHAAAVRGLPTRTRRGRPPQAEALQVEVRSRLWVHPEALGPSEDA